MQAGGVDKVYCFKTLFMINIPKLNFQIVADIKKELRLQGHFLTGELEHSFVEKQSNTDGEIFFEAYAYAFLQELEQGLSKDEIPAFNKNSQEFANLVKWVKLRGLPDSGRYYVSAETIAESIWRKWQRVGKPLEGSKAFSQTGEILGAITEVFHKNDDKYFNSIDEEVVKVLDATYENFNVAIDKI
jgi:hypothetical protein